MQVIYLFIQFKVSKGQFSFIYAWVLKLYLSAWRWGGGEFARRTPLVQQPEAEEVRFEV